MYIGTPRFLRFEDDSDQESISVVCQSDGFFEVPDEESWERCLIGPTCVDPPNAPFEGTVTVIPKVMEVEIEEKCAVDGHQLEVKCPSFQQIYVVEASYGRIKGYHSHLRNN